MQSHPVCNKCGGKGCGVCHNGWACINDPSYELAHLHEGEKCNKCEMGWVINDPSYEMAHPQNGDIYADQNTGKMYVYNGSDWCELVLQVLASSRTDH